MTKEPQWKSVRCEITTEWDDDIFEGPEEATPENYARTAWADAQNLPHDEGPIVKVIDIPTGEYVYIEAGSGLMVPKELIDR